MCFKIGIEWGCGCKWREWDRCAPAIAQGLSGNDCPNTPRDGKNSPKGRNTKTIAKQLGRFIKLRWCCSPACCQASLVSREQGVQLHVDDYNSQWGGTDYRELDENQMYHRLLLKKNIERARREYFTKPTGKKGIDFHYTICIPLFTSGLGKLHSMRGPTEVKLPDFVPTPNQFYLTEKDLERYNNPENKHQVLADKYRNAIVNGNGHQPVVRAPYEQYLTIKMYVVAHPETAHPSWQPNPNWVTQAPTVPGGQGPSNEPVAGPSQAEISESSSESDLEDDISQASDRSHVEEENATFLARRLAELSRDTEDNPLSMDNMIRLRGIVVFFEEHYQSWATFASFSPLEKPGRCAYRQGHFGRVKRAFQSYHAMLSTQAARTGLPNGRRIEVGNRIQTNINILTQRLAELDQWEANQPPGTRQTIARYRTILEYHPHALPLAYVRPGRRGEVAINHNIAPRPSG